LARPQIFEGIAEKPARRRQRTARVKRLLGIPFSALSPSAPAQPAVDEGGDGFERAVLVGGLVVGELGLETDEPGFEDRDLVLERRRPCPNVRSSAVPSNPVSAIPVPAGPARAGNGRKRAGRRLGWRQQMGEPRVDGALRGRCCRCPQGTAISPQVTGGRLPRVG
jgi:hypothetical protein